MPPKKKDDEKWTMIWLNYRKSNFVRSVRHSSDIESELKSTERFAALGPIASCQTPDYENLLRLAG